jgi:hypothetical protein
MAGFLSGLQAALFGDDHRSRTNEYFGQLDFMNSFAARCRRDSQR